jgi:glutamine amidotransferase
MAQPRVAVLSLGASNAANICAGVRRAGGDPYALRSADGLDGADALVLPGVANVAFLIDAIEAAGLREPLVTAIDRGLPTLGICAGFQLCFQASDEAPARRLLGIFQGRVQSMRAPKLPHMGWNHVESTVADFESGWAYFAHSFAAPADAEETIAISRHGDAFASASRKGNVTGLQFHPERSGIYGASLLRSFLLEAAVRC